jgi:glycine/D-amino acid oxidase-like deaminating enzyme
LTQTLAVDVVIFGGGAAGLWTLDELHRAGHSVILLEAGDLGDGQTIASQGIIHGGLKYTLSGLFSPSAKAIADMPLIWRRCLAGEASPDLSHTRLRAQFCHLWRTNSLKSRLAMIGARAGLRVAPVKLPEVERPDALAECRGMVARLDEQVIEPASFLYDLFEQHRARVIRIDVRNGLEFNRDRPDGMNLIRLINPDTGDPLDVTANTVVLTAGSGNARLRESLGLANHAMQLRPLHMVLARGDLPPLNGHCVDGAATRVTITSTRDFADRAVWQIGGQVAEKGVAMDPKELVLHTKHELQSVLPHMNWSGLDWTTYRVDRAEPATRGGLRPEDSFAKVEGNVITAWPTKLALVPQLAVKINALLNVKKIADSALLANALRNWPRPTVALPPWETITTWFTDP